MSNANTSISEIETKFKNIDNFKFFLMIFPFAVTERSRKRVYYRGIRQGIRSSHQLDKNPVNLISYPGFQ